MRMEQVLCSQKYLNQEVIAEMLKKAEYVQAVHDKDRKCLEEYVETKEKIADLKESLEEDQKEQQKKQKEFEKSKRDFECND